MELNIISILVGVLGLSAIIVILFYLTGISMNMNRYDRPKYLPRDDETLWARVIASTRRLWVYNRIKADAMSFDNWDLGILRTDPKILLATFNTNPRVSDVILVPKRWGGYWAVVITQELRMNRYITTYIGEFHSGKIHRDRNTKDSVIIS